MTLPLKITITFVILLLFQNEDLRCYQKCCRYKPRHVHHCRVYRKCIMRMVCISSMLFGHSQMKLQIMLIYDSFPLCVRSSLLLDRQLCGAWKFKHFLSSSSIWSTYLLSLISIFELLLIGMQDTLSVLTHFFDDTIFSGPRGM